MHDIAGTGQSSRDFAWELAAGVVALAEARQGFEQWLTDQVVDSAHSADLIVVLSELAANAIAATGGDENGPIAIRSWRSEDEVVLEVENPPQDSVDHVVVPDDQDPLRGSGRGLLIVAAYTDMVEVIPPGAAIGLIVRCRKTV